VTSAERFYVDPSALRSAYIHDDRSRRFCAWRARTSGTLVVTRHGRAELINSVMLGVFRRVLDQQSARAALTDVEADVSNGSLAVVDILWRRALDLAAELSTVHTAKLGVRTLDVLHVASAMTLEKRVFVTYDDRQAALARAVKLRVLAP
jgi:predicted nucleic acid-binding protein